MSASELAAPPGSALLPCPFCGCSAPHPALRRGFPVEVWCPNCGARGPERLTGREADEAWSVRLPASIGKCHGLIPRLAEAAAHHEHLHRVWSKSAVDARDSVAWVDSDAARIADYEARNPGKPWADVKAYNEASIRHQETTAHQHAEMAHAIRGAIMILHPNAKANDGDQNA